MILGMKTTKGNPKIVANNSNCSVVNMFSQEYVVKQKKTVIIKIIEIFTIIESFILKI